MSDVMQIKQGRLGMGGDPLQQMLTALRGSAIDMDIPINPDIIRYQQVGRCMMYLKYKMP